MGKLSRSEGKQYHALRGLTFEVQVRTVLDHAWAEIEHEIVYKARSLVPPTIRRRFRAIAGTFEVLEAEFIRLRDDVNGVVDSYVMTYLQGREKSVKFDAFRLTAALEVLQPHGKGWRQAVAAGDPLRDSASSVLDALSEVSVDSYTSLAAALRTTRCRRQIEAYASLTGCTKDEVSDLALALIVVGTKNVPVLQIYAPEIAATPAMGEMFGGAS